MSEKCVHTSPVTTDPHPSSSCHTTTVPSTRDANELNMDVSGWGEQGGVYSSDRRYRWSFSRQWGDGSMACWVCLNPGTGDTDRKPRPTLRKMVAWSLRWQCGGIIIVNLFGYR